MNKENIIYLDFVTFTDMAARLGYGAICRLEFDGAGGEWTSAIKVAHTVFVYEGQKAVIEALSAANDSAQAAL